MSVHSVDFEGLAEKLADVHQWAGAFAAASEAFRLLAPQLELSLFFNYLLLGEREQLWLSSYHGIPSEVAADIQHLPLGTAVCGTVAVEGHPILVNRVQESAYDKVQLVRSLGARAYYCFPLLDGERVLGTLSFGSRTRDKFQPAEQNLMQVAAGSVARGIAGVLGPAQRSLSDGNDSSRLKSGSAGQ